MSLPEYFRLPWAEEQGRRVMRSREHIQGSHPLSRYGDCVRRHNLTLGITRGTPAGAGRASPI
jgi:hypothetical protein